MRRRDSRPLPHFDTGSGSRVDGDPPNAVGSGLPDGAFQLPGDTREARFLGAAPPAGHGPHRYFFVVHALDVASIGVPADAIPAVLGFVMSGHVLGRAVLTAMAETPGAERLEVSRVVPAPADAVFAVLTDPQGHVDIDASGMLMAAEGQPVERAGDRFVVHMDRTALGDVPLGKDDVEVVITRLVPGEEIAWTVEGRAGPGRTSATSTATGWSRPRAAPASRPTTTGRRSARSGSGG